ncbi:MAG: thioredoxin 1 [Methanofollis sp.]|nr:thioredoxin 1 [Methanofollis sp.]
MKIGVIGISDHGFAVPFADHRDLAVDFLAEWCGPCPGFAGRVVSGRCNLDENPKTAAPFGPW